jgi:hypothetical protein
MERSKHLLKTDDELKADAARAGRNHGSIWGAAAGGVIWVTAKLLGWPG